MRILVVANAFPYPPTDGNVGPIYHFLRHLAPRLELTMLTIKPAEESAWGQGNEAFAKSGIKVQAVAWREVSKPARALICLRDGRYWANRFYAPELKDSVQAELAHGGYDGVLSWGILSAQHLPKSPGVPHVLMARDCLSLAHRRRFEATRSMRELFQYFKIRAMERDLYRRADRVFAVSPVDAEEMRKIAPAAAIDVLPTGVDAEAFRPMPEKEREGIVLFSGVMDFPPNEDAAVWLAREIWPLVRRERPDAVLRIAGRSATPNIEALRDIEGVTVTGPVERMEDEVARATVVVSPLRFGTGIKNKVMEAAFMAKAMVVTPLSLEGLPLEPGRDCLVESEPEKFAAAIVSLLGDAGERRKLGESARKAIQPFDAKSLALKLIPVFEELKKRN